MTDTLRMRGTGRIPGTKNMIEMIDSLFSVFLLTGALAEAMRKKHARLEGAVAGLPDGEVTLLNQSGVVAKTKISGGKFHLETNVAFPNDYYLLFENGHRVPVIIEKEYIFVDVDFYDDPTFVEITQFDKEKKKLLPVKVPSE